MHGGFFTVRLPECRAHRPEEGFAHRPIGSSSAKGALLGVGPGLCGEFGDHVVHSRRRRIRRGAGTTLGPYPAIGPSRALHGLPGGAPHTEVGRRCAVRPPQDPSSRVDSIQAVARGKPLRISFPTLQGARTPSLSEGAGKSKGGIPAPASVVTGAAYRLGR